MKFLKIRQVCEQTGLSKATLYRLIAEGKFPRQHQISTLRVAWASSEIEEWMQSKLAA